MRRARQLATGTVLGLLCAALALWAADAAGLTRRARPVTTRLVAEDASAPLAVVGIHYAPGSDALAMPVWVQLFAALPPSVRVEVAVAEAGDFERLVAALRRAGTPHLERFHPVVVGREITTWSRDRFAALTGPGGGAVLAPPRVETAFGARAGDAESPHAFSRALYRRPAHISRVPFEGGDLAATPRWLFVGAEIVHRSRGRGAADRATIEAELRRHFAQEIVWLGDEPGEVPHHHVMMYMVPVDDGTMAVGDVRAGLALAAREPAAAALDLDPDPDGHARRFDRVAEILAARGFRVVRVPVLVLRGAGAYVTYTNALFDRTAAGRPVIYLPTYALPALDDAAAAAWAELGFEVRRIDVSSIYRLNGSLGCLVNVLERGPVSGRATP
jgi:N-dimethylarginine dimethylaminohydrolase